MAVWLYTFFRLLNLEGSILDRRANGLRRNLDLWGSGCSGDWLSATYRFRMIVFAGSIEMSTK